MSQTSDLIRKLGRLGASAEIIAIAVEALEAVEADWLAEVNAKRAKDAERQRRHRMSRDVTVTSCDIHDPPSPKDSTVLPLEPSVPRSKPQPPIVPLPKIASTEFEEFWSRWPEKRDKGHAKRAFEGARRKASLADILAGIPGVTATPAWQDGKHVLAATWLNGERWLDEIEGRSGGAPRLVYDAEFNARALEKFRKTLDG